MSNIEKQKIIACVALLLYRRRKSRRRLSVRRQSTESDKSEESERRIQGGYNTFFKSCKLNDVCLFFMYTRMTSAQFDDLLSVVGPFIQETSDLAFFNPEQRLAITLRYLASGDSILSIASGYKVDRSTAREIIIATTKAIWEALQPKYLPDLQLKDYERIASEFDEICNMPNCVGAIDGKSLTIQTPENSKYCVVLLAACDANYNFTFADIEPLKDKSFQGIFSASKFGSSLHREELPLPKPKLLPNTKINIPYYLVGDTSFPLRKQLMRPFADRGLDSKQQMFNKRLARTRIIAENTFGVLAARWKIFSRSFIAEEEHTNNILKACVCLHNFVKASEFHLPEKRYCPPNFVDRDTNNGLELGEWRKVVANSILCKITRIGSNNPAREGVNVRNRLADYFMMTKESCNVSVSLS